MRGGGSVAVENLVRESSDLVEVDEVEEESLVEDDDKSEEDPREER